MKGDRWIAALPVALVALIAGAMLALTPAASPAQEGATARFVGDWAGTLVVGPQRLPLVFHITEAGGSLAATMDSPAQNASGIPMTSVTVSGDSITLSLDVAGARYQGLLVAPDTLDGSWTQGGASFQLELTRDGGDGPDPNASSPGAQPGAAIPDPATRPQTPVPPFPYRSEELSFPGAGEVELAGTLTLPRGDSPHPGAILVTGSGPQDRDETLLGHKPFAVLADHLTRAGIAVLRYDERGVGESTGVFETATSHDLADDAEAALRYLASRPEVDARRVGIIGHSEGGLIGPLVAMESEVPAFVVMLAGPGMTGREIIEDQSRAVALAQGATEEAVEANLAISRQLFDLAVQEADREVAAREMAEVMRRAVDELDPQARAMAGIPEGGADAFIERQVAQVNTPWFRAFLAYDPIPALESLQVPVLAINGELDLQVTHEANLAAIEAALERGGNPDHTVLALPDLNHLFQTATTGSPAEYAQIDETMSPRVLELVADWINERFGDGG